MKIKINESQLRDIITESVMNEFNHMLYNSHGDYDPSGSLEDYDEPDYYESKLDFEYYEDYQGEIFQKHGIILFNEEGEETPDFNVIYNTLGSYVIKFTTELHYVKDDEGFWDDMNKIDNEVLKKKVLDCYEDFIEYAKEKEEPVYIEPDFYD